VKFKIPKKISSPIQKYSPLITIPILCVIFLYGVVIPKDFDIYKKVGFFVIRPYHYGLYLTQQNSKIFYNVSPYQAYYLDGQGNKENLIKWETPIYSKESQLIFDQSKKYQTILHTVLSYLKLQNPSATFTFNKNELVLGSRVEGNKIAFVISKNTFTLSNSRTLFMTLSFSQDDIIFDENGFVYTQSADADTLNDINNALGLNLKPAQNPGEYLDSKTLYVFNRDLNGILKFEAKNNNQEIAKLNLEENLIEFKVLSRGLEKPYIEIEVADNFGLKI